MAIFLLFGKVAVLCVMRRPPSWVDGSVLQRVLKYGAVRVVQILAATDPASYPMGEVKLTLCLPLHHTIKAYREMVL